MNETREKTARTQTVLAIFINIHQSSSSLLTLIRPKKIYRFHMFACVCVLCAQKIGILFFCYFTIISNAHILFHTKMKNVAFRVSNYANCNCSMKTHIIRQAKLYKFNKAEPGTFLGLCVCVSLSASYLLQLKQTHTVKASTRKTNMKVNWLLSHYLSCSYRIVKC